MGSHSQLSLGPMEGKPVVSKRTNGGPAVGQAVVPAANMPERERSTYGPATGQAVVPAPADGLTLLVDACEDTLSDKEAYIALGLPDATYWSKVKTREKPAPRIPKLTDLPEPAQREYCKRWARQLRMHVSDEDDRRTALNEAVCALAHALRVIG